MQEQEYIPQELSPEDLDWCVKRLPRKVASALKNFAGNVCVGGGYIRSCITEDHLKDFDLFVNSGEVAELVNKHCKNEDQKDFKTKNAYTILRGEKPPIQIITRWLYGKPQDVLGDLDFTICCAVIWFENGRFRSAVHPLYYSDLAAKRLRYTSPNRIEECGGSLLRVLKYYNKGYRIMLTSYARTIARMMMGVKGLEFKGSETSENSNDDWSAEKQLAKIINGLLVEVDPNAVGEVDFVRDTDEEEEQNDL